MDHRDFTVLMSVAKRELAYLADMATHEIIYMSEAAMELAGYSSPADYRGKHCYEVIPGEDSPCLLCHSECPIEPGGPWVREHFHPVLKKWLRIERRPVMVEGRHCWAHWATDITREHGDIQALYDRLHLETAMAQCGRALCLEPDAHTAMERFLASIGEYYGADRACVFEIDYAHMVVNNTYEWCAPNVPSQMPHVQNFPLSDALLEWSRSFRDSAVNRFSAKEHTGGFADIILADREAESILVVPLSKGSELIGYLGVDNARLFTDSDTLLRRAADLVTEDFQRRQLLWDLSSQEYSDHLTGLQNRARYLQTLELYRKLPPSSLAVFFLDLNGLKELNEQSGHDAGDRFICRCADVLRSQELNVFRVDGDEFIILQPGVSRAEGLHTEALIRKALEALHPYSVSLGHAWAEGDVDVLALITEADQRMYAEKQIYYRTALSQERPHRAGMATEVLRDIQNGSFLVYFQPQVDLRTGALYGAEALVRKVDEDGHLISPDHFVPFYEAEGVISHMDFHVLELVCDMVIFWEETMGKHPKISVNFSRQTLMEPNVVSRISQICAERHVNPRQITIEVTESAGKLSQEQLAALVASLHQAGFSVSLDDFGSRYSNLSILTGIDFQMIKLDKSLIDQVGQVEKSTNIVKNLVSLCRETISTPSLAEGVETHAQVSALQDISCDYVQGYYFSRPIPADAFSDLLRSDVHYPVCAPHAQK